MGDPLEHRRILVGVSGSIAAYKALSLASGLVAAGAEVDVILTEAAAHLVQPLSFQAMTHRPVVTTLWQPIGEMGLDHIALARGADLLIVAPATADILARLALGLADDALTTTALACTAPLIVAPAMEMNMWAHAATQRHVRTLAERGAVIVGPTEGRMASGQVGLGRMVDPDEVLEQARTVLAHGGDLAGVSILVTAGPTREPMDPLRYISNRSSGRMGYCIARQARNRGAAVTLVTGPVQIPTPIGVTAVAVETAAEMLEAVTMHLAAADVLVMTAAVADFRPARYSEAKIKKSQGVPDLPLAPNPDLLERVDALVRATPALKRLVRIGFAAETDDLIANAREKRERKGLDLIVANPVPATFGATEIAATLVDDTATTELGTLSKDAMADALLDWARQALRAREA